MSKMEILLAKLLANPIPTDFTYHDLVKLMAFFGYEVDEKASGSRVRFFNHKTKAVLCLHKPHPNSQLKKYQMANVIEFLKDQGDIYD